MTAEYFTLRQVAEKTGISLRLIEDGCRADPPTIEHTIAGRGVQKKHRVMTQAQVDKLVASRSVGAAAPVTRPLDDIAAIVAAARNRPARGPRRRAA